MGGTFAAYVATNNAAQAGSLNSSKSAVAVQSKETNDQSKEVEIQDANVTLPAGGISQATAEKTALGSVPGGTVVTSQLEDENSVIVYGVEIKSENTASDVKVNATTGAIVKSDPDNDKIAQSNKEESQTIENDNIQHKSQNDEPAGYED